MNIIAVTALLAFAPIGLALLFLYRALALRPDGEAALEKSLVLSVEKYHPMDRLLRAAHVNFLSAQPGYSRALGRRFRRERRRIFRGYLRAIKLDFSRISTALNLVVVNAAEDRADLAAGLIRQRFLFAVGMLAVEGRLLLHTAGL